jgi:FkbM family methyltransferase
LSRCIISASPSASPSITVVPASHPALAKLRPAKLRSALKRRWFEYRMSRVQVHAGPTILELGSDYGGWALPGEAIDASWTCYLVGAGGDVSLELELVSRYGASVRSFDAVADFVESALSDAGEPRLFSAHHAAVAVTDGPIRMQRTHDPSSQSVSAAELYDSANYVELPGRTLSSLMGELGDARVELLKLDVEGSEYELLPTLDLCALGVRLFAAQLHHNGTVRQAKRLIASLREQGYELVACRPVVKLAFLHRDLL